MFFLFGGGHFQLFDQEFISDLARDTLEFNCFIRETVGSIRRRITNFCAKTTMLRNKADDEIIQKYLIKIAEWQNAC